MHRRPLPRVVTALWLALLASALGAACPRRGGSAPKSVLLVSIDSLRADHVGCYGYGRATSPTLDRLAAEGVRFTDAQSSTSWTLPSHVSMLTARTQVHHRVVISFDSIPANEELVQEVFAKSGYETVGFYSGPLLHPAFGFARGFAAYVSCQAEETERLHGPQAWESSHADRTGPIVEARFGDWVSGRKDARRPFFAFVHLWDVHYDYIPPPPYDTMFDPDYHGPLDGRDILGNGFPLDASPRDVEHLRALYDGELRSTDRTVAALLAMLDKARLLDDTLVVVTGDHGEEFLEHGGKTHQRTIFQEVLHVPLILWSRSGLPRGLTITEPVTIEDIAPTVLELAGLHQLEHADGRSLAPLLGGGSVEHPPLTSALYFDFSNELGFVGVRRKETRLIYSAEDDVWQEYDLHADPGEQQPHEVRDQELKAALDRQVEEARTMLAARARSGKRHRAAVPPDIVEKLKKLGYLRE